MTRTLAIACALIMAAGTASVQAKTVDWNKIVAGSGQEQEDGKEQDNGKEQGDGKQQDDGKEQGQDQDDKGQGFLVAGSGQEQEDGKEQDNGKEQDDGKQQDDGKEQGQDQDDKGQGFLVAGSGQEQEDGKEQDDGKQQDDGKEQGQDQDDKGQDKLLASLGLATVSPEAPHRRRVVTACYARNAWGGTFQAAVRGRLGRRGLNMLQMRAVQTCRQNSPFLLRRTCRPIGCQMVR